MNAPLLFRTATQPGDPARPNEDLPGVLGECAILLDGSGAPGNLPTGCVHGVPWFVRQLGTRCLEHMAITSTSSLPGILSKALTEVSALHADTCDLSRPGTPSAVITMARYTGDRMEWLVLGDVALAIETAAGAIAVVTDKRMEDAAPPEYWQMLALPTGTPEHQAARMAFVRKQQPTRNKPGGYPVASTWPQAADEALTGSIPIDDVRRAVLASDGVTRFVEFGLGSWSDMLDVLTSGGPHALFARIRQAETSDPAGKRWPRAKLHDDVGLVFCELAPRTV